MLAYQGTAYCGWQVQPRQASVQSVLEDAIRRMIGQTVRVRAASRTDAGVHAAGQVVCFDHDSRHDPRALQKGLNALLPEDVVVRAAEAVSADFDPRRAGLGKHYRYTIHNSAVRPLFSRRLRWHLRVPLDPAAMNLAARALQGEHDFSSFRGSGCEARSPVRTVDRARFLLRGERLIFEVLGRSFLKQMVRNLIGSLVEVGRGRWEPTDLQQVLAACDRRRAGPTAPARGLCLERVFFDEADYQEALKALDNAD